MTLARPCRTQTASNAREGSEGEERAGGTVLDFGTSPSRRPQPIELEPMERACYIAEQISMWQGPTDAHGG
jgi:hypothetical protein